MLLQLQKKHNVCLYLSLMTRLVPYFSMGNRRRFWVVWLLVLCREGERGKITGESEGKSPWLLWHVLRERCQLTALVVRMVQISTVWFWARSLLAPTRYSGLNTLGQSSIQWMYSEPMAYPADSPFTWGTALKAARKATEVTSHCSIARDTALWIKCKITILWPVSGDC